MRMQRFAAPIRVQLKAQICPKLKEAIYRANRQMVIWAPRNCKLCNQHFLHQFLIHSLQFVSILSNFIIRACFVFDLALFFRVGCRDLNRCLQSLISHVSVYSG